MTAQPAPVDVLIVGAGLAGLCAARELQRAGRSVRVLDKGRGVGGRLASRRMGSAVLDHGAQFFTLRSDQSRNLLANWFEDGTLQEWARGFALAGGGKKLDDVPRYIAPQGMNVLAKLLATGVPVTTGTRVASVRTGGAGWAVHTESGAVYGAHTLLLTAPVPQSMALLAAGDVQIDAAQAAALGGILIWWSAAPRISRGPRSTELAAKPVIRFFALGDFVETAFANCQPAMKPARHQTRLRPARVQHSVRAGRPAAQCSACTQCRQGQQLVPHLSAHLRRQAAPNSAAPAR